MVYGAILAGGVGKRVERTQTPKQFIEIGGQPIIVITLKQFIEIDEMDRIYIAVHADWKEYLGNLLDKYFSKEECEKIRIVVGGKERLDSFINILDSIIDTTGLSEEDILICHDSVRPFVRKKMILDCIEETKKHGVALTVTPAEDTMYSSSMEGFIDGTLDRSTLFKGQTPSGFKATLLKEVCDSVSEDEKKKITGTTQLMLKKGYNLKIVEGHTSNFKITTDNDLDIADRMVRTPGKTNNIHLLDCTLRDGGIVIDFNFGNSKMQEIKGVLEDSGIKYIECGYINQKTGSESERTSFNNEVSIEKGLLSTGKKSDIKYLAMIDYGTYDLSLLNNRTENGIDGIRYAFHKENWRDAIENARIIVDKGYELYVQPMVSMRYDDDEFRELIRTVNEKLPEAKAFYIVDSFGQMDNIHLLHKLQIADQEVADSMKIGFHAHNNRQLAYSNALAFIGYIAEHDLMLDSSIMGMGKGAGNLCTELITNSLVGTGMVFKTHDILAMIADYFAPLQKESPWGYSLEYYFAAVYGCTPSYIKIFMKDERVTTGILVELLKDMPVEKRAACDKAFAAEYLKSHFEKEGK